jgi:CHAT domain-containing protein/tetratricopeptide (TPR) repeat protein
MTPPRGRAREDRFVAQLGKARDERSRRALLARNRPLATAAFVERLGEEVIRRFRVDLDEAMALADAAEAIAREVGGAEPRARAARAKGNVLFGRDDHRAAVARLEEAARLFEEAGQPTEVARTFSTTIQPLILLGEYARAEEAAARAREIFTREGDALRLARLEINVGNIHHRQDRFTEALACYERAYERLVPMKNVEGVAVALGNMAMVLITLNDFARAMETHRRARAYCEEHGLPRLVALADYNIAYLYFFRGQYGEAIEALKATRAACEALGDRYLAALCRLDLAEIYLELNLSADAAAMAEEAQAAFEGLGNGYEAAKARGFLAIAQGQQGKVLRSLELFAQAKAGFVSERNAAWPGLMDLYRAMILMAAGRLFEARRSALEALSGFSAPALASKAILCRLLLARLALRMGDPDGARDECDRAAERLASLDLPALSFQMHFVRGQIARAAGEAAAAYGAFRAALGFLETLRSSLRGEELKIAFLKNKLEVYENVVELCLARDGPGAAEEAFGYVEQAKSRSLQELLMKSAAPAAAPHPTGKSDIVRRVGELREELNWYYHRIEAEQLSAEEKAEGRIDALRSAVSAHEAELLRVLRDLPLEAEPRELLAPVSLPLEAVRAAIPEDATIVEYFRVGSRLLAFLVARDTIEVVPVAVVPRVQHLLRLLQFQLGWARPGASDASETSRRALSASTEAHLRELYDELVAPLRDRLRGRHLVVVPHDLLHYVPFHALHDGKAHLIDSFSISYAPSATIYALCHARPPRTGGRSLVLGAPEEHTPAIADEAREVAARLPDARLFIGEAATADVLREHAPHSRYVHVAAHGFFRADNPMFSGIRLAGSYLTLYDLHALRMPAELVALSACVSGLNVIGAGDEILGLSRGLFRAGADSLLLTLWEVPDESTALFMEDFYDRALRTGNRAQALRAAILALRERFPHPIYWAPFVLAGKFARD